MNIRRSSTDLLAEAELPEAFRPFRVARHDKRSLRDWDTEETCGLDSESARSRFGEVTALLAERQEMLFAQGRHRLLVIFQATDTGGKDGTIRNVFHEMDPAGVRVVSFKSPTRKETDHDYLWRIHAHTPTAGEIAVFNRSHYEDVLVPRVRKRISASHCRKRFRHIRHFERMLSDEGTTIVKFFLHISRDEQQRRLQARIDDPRRNWKFHPADLKERNHWSAYQRAYDDLLPATSRMHTPGYVIPADHKWFRNLAVAEVLLAEMDRLGMRWPDPDPGLKGLKVL